MRKLLLLVVLLLPVSLHAATRVWTGAVNHLWSVPGNWDTGAPVAGDDLSFTGSVQTNTANDYPAGTVFRSITASDNAWTFSGNGIELTNGIATLSATYSLPIIVGGTQQWTALCCATATFTEDIDLNGHALTLRGNPLLGGQGGRIVVSGAINGSGSITANGRLVTFSGDNTYSGPTESSALAVQSDTGLGIADGTLANGTTIHDALLLDGAAIGNEAITFTNPTSQLIGRGTASIDGPLFMPSGGTLVAELGGHLTVNAPITGTTVRVLSSGSTVTFNNASSSYTRLEIHSSEVRVIVGTDGAIPASAYVLLESGIFDMNDRTTSVQSFDINPSLAPAPTFAAGSQPLVVADFLRVAGGNLTLTGSFNGTTGTSYTIIRNDGSGAVVGQFNGLPEGSSFVVRGQTYFITYFGGDGNDVVLHVGAPPSLISIADATAFEGDGVAVFDVTISSAPAAPLVISYTTFDGTAVAGSDYLAETGTLPIPADATHATIEVALVNDSTEEPDQTFGLRLTGVTGGGTIQRAEGLATIVDDDAAFVTTTHEYARIGARPLVLDLTVPLHGTPPYPVIVWIHGGQWRSGSRTPNPALREVARGYAVAAVQYRLSGEAVFPAQIADVKAAVRWLRAHAGPLHLDPLRIGAWGHGAGGHLAALLGTAGFAFDDPAQGNAQFSSRVAAVVDWGGPSNLLRMNATALPCSTIDHDAPDSPESQLLGCTLPTCPAKAREASPDTWASADDPPFHIVHGDQDCLVPPAQSLELFNALRAAGADASLLLAPGVAGTADPYWSSEAALSAVDAFFDAKLKNRKPPRRRAVGK